MDFSLKDIDVRSILRDLRRNLFFIFLAGLTAYIMIFSVYNLKYTPEYKSTATLSISMKGNNGNPFSSVHITNEIAGVFREVFGSDALKKKIAQALDEDSVRGDISINIIEETNLMVLTVVSDSPKNSYMVINAALANYQDISDYLFSNASVHVLKEPIVPLEASNPPHSGRICKIASVAAVFITCCFIALFSFMRPTVKNPSSAKRKLDGDIIGVIPYVKKYKTKDEIKTQLFRLNRKNEAVLITSPRFGMNFIESVKKISSIVERHMKNRKQQVLLITSVSENEGKSSVLANLAISFAQKGHKVLIIDADLRKPAFHKIFEVDNENNYSLSDCLSSNEGKIDIYKHSTEGVYCLYQYKGSGDPVNLLSSKKMGIIIDVCRKKFDYIFIDSSPLGVVTDCEILMQYSDAVLVTVREDCSPVGIINDITDVIRKSDKDFIGFVLNAFKSVSHKKLSGRGYGYGYGYGYGDYGKYSKSGR